MGKSNEVTDDGRLPVLLVDNKYQKLGVPIKRGPRVAEQHRETLGHELDRSAS